MSIKSSPFDQFNEDSGAGLGPKGAGEAAGQGKQANQFYQTAYVQGQGNAWVDKKTLEETSF